MANVAWEFIDIGKVLDIFSIKQRILEYQNYVNKIGNTAEIIDIKDCRESVKENTIFIDSIAHAKEALVYRLADRNLSIEEYIAIRIYAMK